MGSLCLITHSGERAVQAAWNTERWRSSESAAVVFYCSNLFSPSVAVAVKEIVSHAPLSLVYSSAQISAVLLWACSGWIAKLSSQHCSTFHSQSQQTCALWSISGPGIQVLFVQYFWRKKKRRRRREKKCKLFFSFTMAERNILWHLNREPCITAPAARCLDRITHVKQE